MASFEDADDIRLEGIEEFGRVDGRVDDGLSRWGCLRLDVWKEESQGVSWLGGEDREQCDKLGGLVVGKVCEDEGFGVVLVDSVRLSAGTQ